MKRRITHIIATVKDLPEFTQQSMLGGMAYSANNQRKFTSKKISEVVSQLRELRQEYNGSEPQSNLMEKKVEFIQTLESQHEALESYLIDIKDAYHEVTGSDWVPPSKTPTSRLTETQAASDADAILAKY